MKISARNFLFKEGDKIENLYIVRSGSLNALRKEFKRIKIIESFLPGSIIGEIPSTENEKHLYSVRAEENSEIEIIPIHLIHSVLQETPNWFPKFIQTLQWRKQNLICKEQKKLAILSLPAFLFVLNHLIQTSNENSFSLEKILSLLESLLSTSQEIIERLCYALHSIGFFLFDGKNIQVLKPTLPIMLYDVLQEKAIYKTQPEKIFSSTSQILLKTFVTAALKEGTTIENDLTEISGHAFNQAAPVYSKGSRKIFKELENHKILHLKPASSENFNDDKLYGNLKYIQDLLELNRIYPLLDQELAKHL